MPNFFAFARRPVRSMERTEDAVSLTTEQIEEIVSELATRPGHEKVRGFIYKLLTDGLGASSRDISFEHQTFEVRGRMDALLGRTVIELKSDLRREEFERQLTGYLRDRQSVTGHDFVGIVTDGSLFSAHQLSRDGGLEELAKYRVNTDEPREILAWLESVVALQDKLYPDVRRIQTELGREAVLYRRALRQLEDLWSKLCTDPEVHLKRQLWHRLIHVAYGAEVDAPELFLQHTYLVIVAKAIATAALMGGLPDTGRALLDGHAFQEQGIVGAVEADFFDWILSDAEGDRLVLQIARQVARFDLGEIETDVLKGLYESLIDPTTRHDLGEYYTPDWLANRICAEVIKAPLEQRVLDPACGSGTFLFQAVRRLCRFAAEARLKPADTVRLAEDKVAGIEVHPVAVIFARVTWLLALQPVLAKGRPATLSVPVYLGDALQWNARELMGVHELEVIVPPANSGGEPAVLRFPEGVVVSPASFDETLGTMLDLAERDRPAAELEGWLRAREVGTEPERKMLSQTYKTLRKLNEDGRNHIWGYVARNLSRPIWLATERQKADVVVGNPPWLDYRRMGPATQSRFHSEMVAAGLWDRKVHGMAFDLSAYFLARSVHLYMRQSGRLAFVMPYASMTRRSYEAFLRGGFKVGGFRETVIKFTSAWTFPSEVYPLFPVPSCVLFVERSKLPQPLPVEVRAFRGHLPRRDASPVEADNALKFEKKPWPTQQGVTATSSPYRKKFLAGAKLDPRRLILVEAVSSGRLGSNPDAPLVRGRTGNLDKEPWKHVPAPQGPVESSFIRAVYLGESIAPFRLFTPVQGVIPYDEVKRDVLSSSTAAARGFPRLSQWLASVEALWAQHGKGKTTFAEKVDFYKLLSKQFPLAPLRVVYSKSGSNPASTIVRDASAIIDHKLYWMACSREAEAYYLMAIFNSEVSRSRAARWQSEGQWGKRDFDKVMFNLPIPLFQSSSDLHSRLVAASKRAEGIATRVPIDSEKHFIRARRRIREGLAADGVSIEIDALVSELLGPA
ncbi:MAG TPA: N-6 DNA methylase [Allosphingosinicella sp.]